MSETGADIEYFTLLRPRKVDLIATASTFVAAASGILTAVMAIVFGLALLGETSQGETGNPASEPIAVALITFLIVATVSTAIFLILAPKAIKGPKPREYMMNRVYLVSGIKQSIEKSPHYAALGDDACSVINDVMKEIGVAIAASVRLENAIEAAGSAVRQEDTKEIYRIGGEINDLVDRFTDISITLDEADDLAAARNADEAALLSASIDEDREFKRTLDAVSEIERAKADTKSASFLNSVDSIEEMQLKAQMLKEQNEGR